MQGACVIAVLAALAVPLSSLMVAQSTADVSATGLSVAADSSVDQAADVSTAEASETSSAVTALMAGSAVGPSRGAVVDPRHPASAFIP